MRKLVENSLNYGFGYYIDRVNADEFAEKYVSGDGEIINTHSVSFKLDLAKFLCSHKMVESASTTANTKNRFARINSEEVFAI